jgi:hypothetical protein
LQARSLLAGERVRGDVLCARTRGASAARAGVERCKLGIGRAHRRLNDRFVADQGSGKRQPLDRDRRRLQPRCAVLGGLGVGAQRELVERIGRARDFALAGAAADHSERDDRGDREHA